MDFGEALAALKAGKRVTRPGWNGKGMWLALIPGDGWHLRGNSLFQCMADGDHFKPWIGMHTADAGFVPWLASQTDVLAEDWEVFD